MIATPGDILLFRGNGVGCRIQRLLTGGSYDHVALLFRDRERKLMIMEAVQSVGVTCSYWYDFIENDLRPIYDKITYRHLCCQRTDEAMKKLCDFLKVIFYL